MKFGKQTLLYILKNRGKTGYLIAALLVVYGLNNFFVSKMIELSLSSYKKESLSQKNLSSEATDEDVFFVNHTVIFDRNIFNIEGAIADELELSDMGVCKFEDGEEPENEDYDLLGIIYGGSSESSAALLLNKHNGRAIVKKLNDPLPNREKLIRISSKKIWIQSEGCPIGISLKVPIDPSKTKSPTSLAKLEKYKEVGFERSGTQVKTSRQWVNKELGSNLNKTMEDARAIPNFSGGRIKGFKLVEITHGSLYEKIGLHDNDIILSINGNELNDAARAIQTLNSLRNASSLNLKVLRNNDVINLTMEVQ